MMGGQSFSVLARLHDALLVSLRMDWASSQVSIFVRTADDTYRMSFEQVIRLVCPRIAGSGRIGPGIRIHTVRQLGSTTEVEMQSGDVIEVDGALTGFDVVPR
jgi:hypothetical protein